MTNDLTPEEKAYLKFVQLKDEIKTLINNLIVKSSETIQRQEDATTKMIAHFDGTPVQAWNKWGESPLAPIVYSGV